MHQAGKSPSCAKFGPADLWVALNGLLLYRRTPMPPMRTKTETVEDLHRIAAMHCWSTPARHVYDHEC